MSELKERLQKEISDADFSPKNIPAIQKAVQSVENDEVKKKELFKSFPGVLLLGDWRGEGINLDFFENVKNELIKEHCNAFT